MKFLITLNVILREHAVPKQNQRLSDSLEARIFLEFTGRSLYEKYF